MNVNERYAALLNDEAYGTENGPERVRRVVENPEWRPLLKPGRDEPYHWPPTYQPLPCVTICERGHSVWLTVPVGGCRICWALVRQPEALFLKRRNG